MGPEKASAAEFIERDTSITASNSFTLLMLDSLHVENYIEEQGLDGATSKLMRNFYNHRNYQYAWFTDDGPAEHTRAFWNLHQQYLDLNRDSSIFHQQLHARMNEVLNDGVKLSPEALAQTELELTSHFFEFADYAYTGKVDPEKLQWYIPKMKIDAVKLLDSLTQTKGENLENWEPVNEQYQQLKLKLAAYYKISKDERWQQLELGKKKVLKKNDAAAAVVVLKNNLFLLEDYESAEFSPLFTPELEEAVQNFQARFGLEQDGVVGPEVVKAINVPPEKRIQQVLMNMERMRWLPVDGKGKRVVVNIPEFRLRVYDESHERLNMAIIVGKAATETIIFSGEIKYVVFAPYWNVPKSIVRNEILPALSRNSNYLNANHMEITGRVDGLPEVRQKPGPWNALGRVKFLFPNNYHIYLHDTPARSLFKSTTRDFSHGCIRIEDPEAMASFLLDSNEWSTEKISEEMNGAVEKWVTLKKPVPVFITYFTAWVDQNGKLNFRNDIYGHDRILAQHLFEFTGQ